MLPVKHREDTPPPSAARFPPRRTSLEPGARNRGGARGTTTARTYPVLTRLNLPSTPPRTHSTAVVVPPPRRDDAAPVIRVLAVLVPDMQQPAVGWRRSLSRCMHESLMLRVALLWAGSPRGRSAQRC